MARDDTLDSMGWFLDSINEVEYVIGVPQELINDIFPIIGDRYHTTMQIGGYVIYHFSLPVMANDPIIQLVANKTPHFSVNKNKYKDQFYFYLHKFLKAGEYTRLAEMAAGPISRACKEVICNHFLHVDQAAECLKQRTLKLLGAKPYE